MPIFCLQQSVHDAPAGLIDRTGSSNGLTNASLRNELRRIASLLRHPWLGVYAIEATLEGERLQVLVLDDGTTLSYIKSLFADEEVSVSQKGAATALKASTCIRSGADVVIVGANQLLADQYARRGFRIVPKWVRLFLPVREEPYARIHSLGRQARKYFKWMLRKVQDAGFECEILTDHSWLDRFYHEMYRPYALQRFGEEAVVHSCRTVKKSFDRGAVAVVKRDGNPVAGTVIYRDRGILRLPHTGVAGGDPDAMRDGAAFALDYYLAQYAHSQGCAFVDFGHSRPFLSDGTLRYKMNWHMDVLPDDDGTGVFAIATPNNTSQAAKFLAANPHFYLTESGCRLSEDEAEIRDQSDE